MGGARLVAGTGGHQVAGVTHEADTWCQEGVEIEPSSGRARTLSFILRDAGS